MYDSYYYEQQRDQAREEYYTMGITDGYNDKPIEYIQEEYLLGYKLGLFDRIDTLVNEIPECALSTGEPPF